MRSIERQNLEFRQKIEVNENQILNLKMINDELKKRVQMADDSTARAIK